MNETNKIFTIGELDSKLNPLISLPLPPNGRLGRRSLFNQSHALTLNVLQRINESSQISAQITYTNDRQEAFSERKAEYFTIEETEFLKIRNNMFQELMNFLQR